MTDEIETGRLCLRCAANDPTCSSCGGAGVYERPTEEVILAGVIAGRGPYRGSIRNSAPPYRLNNLTEMRVYFVWRLYRLYAGIDTRMPYSAEYACAYDPWAPELRELAKALAEQAKGT